MTIINWMAGVLKNISTHSRFKDEHDYFHTLNSALEGAYPVILSLTIILEIFVHILVQRFKYTECKLWSNIGAFSHSKMYMIAATIVITYLSGYVRACEYLFIMSTLMDFFVGHLMVLDFFAPPEKNYLRYVTFPTIFVGLLFYLMFRIPPIEKLYNVILYLGMFYQFLAVTLRALARLLMYQLGMRRFTLNYQLCVIYLLASLPLRLSLWTGPFLDNRIAILCFWSNGPINFLVTFARHDQFRKHVKYMFLPWYWFDRVPREHLYNTEAEKLVI